MSIALLMADDVIPLTAAIRAARFCRWWRCLNPDSSGPVVILCECMVWSGSYADYESGRRVLDRHLDDQELAEQAFIVRWTRARDRDRERTNV